MMTISIPANTITEFTPDSAGNIIQNPSVHDTVEYSFDNDRNHPWFRMQPLSSIRVDKTVYFYSNLKGVELVSDKDA